MMGRPQPIMLTKPDAAVDVSGIADRVLQRAGAVGILPTPIDQLIAAERLGMSVDAEPLVQGFLARLTGQAKDTFISGLQKLRGIADLRERAIYVASDVKPARVIWAKSHELGHQVLPWHTVDVGYTDDDRSLSADAQELFDQEANLFASEVIFQGRRFQRLARDYQPSLDAVFTLADQHGASRQATLWRFVEDHDEPIAAVLYWPSWYVYDASGERPLTRGRAVVVSPSFRTKFASVSLPERLPSDHPWTAARRASRGGVECDVDLKVDGEVITFQSFAWWNTYCLMVLIRRRPRLHIISDLLRT
jgi:hypothetical protein